ncbi:MULTISPECIES: hypothetical protein [unclassified Methylobacterium]|uniref:hypothetical protein n=1 Tax=unclassified Methylobacterium TaxID=2615210 RepID=UPI001F1D68F8|nr:MULTISPECIES: hypothetical protein [Methylobacterium]WFT83297.1 hypothetical protein QA634_16315 [Methylobacterium nodulans]
MAQASDMPAGMPAAASLLQAAECIFAHEIRDFIAEFCLLDGGVLIGWVRDDRHGNIADLVASSAEPFFKESTLTYADAADVSFSWGRSPTVVLDMEFGSEAMTVFFKLVLDGTYVGVAIDRILAGPGLGLDLERFAEVLTRARLAPA